MAEYGITNWRGRQVFTLATEHNLIAMEKAALLVQRDVKTHFTTIRGKRDEILDTGRAAVGKQQNDRGSFTKFHYRSLPGEPPAVETGVLRASIMGQAKVEGIGITGKVGPDIDHIRAEAPVGTDVEYGYYLELGTSEMDARPYLRPSLRRTAKKVKQIFDKANS